MNCFTVQRQVAKVLLDQFCPLLTIAANGGKCATSPPILV